MQKFTPLQNECFLHKFLYSFKSPKSNQTYWVWVEVYQYNMHALKFHLKSDRDNPNRYSRLTGCNEFRQIINTCIAIMLEINNKHKTSSFGFIGSHAESAKKHEGKENTQRYRIYKRIMVTYFSEQHFKHVTNVNKSTYMLIRRTELDRVPDLVERLEMLFTDNYAYFE